MAKRYVRKKRKGARRGLVAAALLLAILAIVGLIFGISACRRSAASSGDGLWDGSWYADGLDRIGSDRALVRGMRTFEKKTGVRPFLTLLDGVDPAELDAFVADQYEALFDSGDHLLVVYDEWGEGTYYLSAHAGATDALTEEDEAALLSALETAYADPAHDSYAEAFGAGFRTAGESIAAQRPTGAVGLLVAVGLLLVLLSFLMLLFLRTWTRRRG